MDEAPMLTPSGEKPKYSAPAKLGMLKYLIVDDIGYMRAMLKAFLHAYGISNVLEAEGAVAALGLFAAHEIDVLLTNFMMPVMNGGELVRRLRRSPGERLRRIPVVMVSAYTDRDHIRRARDAGIDEFVSKPCTAEDLHVAIRKAVFAPKPFVVAPDYLGPDRRREDRGASKGHERRGMEIG